jgi:heme-degrading monooxygenase HmoA
MYVIVFRNRLKPDAMAEYTDWAERMGALARTMPGYVSHKGFTAADGERVTLVEFATEEGLRAWATHPEHVTAKQHGRAGFYSEYSLQVCTEQRVSRFTAPP